SAYRGRFIAVPPQVRSELKLHLFSNTGNAFRYSIHITLEIRFPLIIFLDVQGNSCKSILHPGTYLDLTNSKLSIMPCRKHTLLTLCINLYVERKYKNPSSV